MSTENIGINNSSPSDSNKFDEKLYLLLFADVANALTVNGFRSGEEHYNKHGKTEIESGTRSFLSQSNNVDAQTALASLSVVIGRISKENLVPWIFLSKNDQALIGKFINILFEIIYVASYPDLQKAVGSGTMKSGLLHWIEHGREEIIKGERNIGSVTTSGRTHALPAASVVTNANLHAILGAIDDWGSFVHACAAGVEFRLAPLGPQPDNDAGALPTAYTAIQALNNARAIPVELAIHTDIHSGTDSLYGCDPKVIAFYLPQYHRVRENDEWWGEGFTEWTNVRKAKPNFIGHNQPHVPLGHEYYDLADPTVQRRQAALAKEYGVTAFCYYLYWFDGRRMLERPLDQMLADDTIDHEFCVCWANENWTRTWDGKADDILIGQTHTPAADRRFIRDTLKYLRDPRYLRIDGKLALLVYRVDLLSNCRETTRVWREEVRKAGLGELHLCAVQFYGVTDPEPWGFDAAVEFPPHGWLVPENAPCTPPTLLNSDFQGHIFDYQKTVEWALSKPIPDYRWYRGVFPGWDNTARRQDTPHIFAHSDPYKFESWLTEIIRQTVIMAPIEHQVVFVNAWNEWGEGAHLEPDEQTGRLNLMALNSAIKTAKHEAWPLGALGRLRQVSSYPGRDKDERALLNLLRAQERAFSVLTAQLRATGVNPFV